MRGDALSFLLQRWKVFLLSLLLFSRRDFLLDRGRRLFCPAFDLRIQSFSLAFSLAMGHASLFFPSSIIPYRPRILLPCRPNRSLFTRFPGKGSLLPASDLLSFPLRVVNNVGLLPFLPCSHFSSEREDRFFSRRFDLPSPSFFIGSILTFFPYFSFPFFSFNECSLCKALATPRLFFSSPPRMR